MLPQHRAMSVHKFVGPASRTQAIEASHNTKWARTFVAPGAKTAEN